MGFLDSLKLGLNTWKLAARSIAVLHRADETDGSIVPIGSDNPLPVVVVGGSGGGGGTDVSALSKETTQGQVLSSLQALKAAVQAQIDIASSVWTDNSGAYYVRRDLVNEGNGTVSVSFTDPSGAAATPGAGLRPLASASRVVIEAQYDALAGGTGYSTGDLLARVAIYNPDTQATVYLWQNLTAGSTLSSAPAANTVQRADEAVTARLADANGAAITLGQKAAANSLPVVLASDQALPLPAGAATEATLAAQSAKLPASLGQKAGAASLSVVQASDGPGSSPAKATFGQVTDGTNVVAVKAGNTSPAPTDSALVVVINPNSPQPRFRATGTPAAVSSITNAGQAQPALNANATRTWLFVQNNSSAELWFNFTGTAAVGAGIRLLAGQSYENPPHFSPTGAVSVYGATAGQAYTAVEA